MVSQATQFFKTLFKATSLESKAACIVGDIKEINIPIYGFTDKPDYREITVSFWVKDKGSLEEIFKSKRKESIIDILNKMKKTYKLSITLEEIK